MSRGSGRSAVAAAAYMSCSRIQNDYDGITHDYRRKKGLLYEKVFLPANAPPEWKDRAVLWNAVESSEKTKNSRLAREFVVALPIELPLEENVKLLKSYVQEQFVSDGICADVCIHDTDGHNPHAHILMTIRPLDKNGKWQSKTEKEYLCIKDGTEKAFTAAEFRKLADSGWEKQYLYYVNGKKVYLPPSEAEGLKRADKTPKSSRYGRQNPITARWNSKEQLFKWREEWANTVNRALERNGYEVRIDHRSFIAMGIRIQPTVHEGYIARKIQKLGKYSDRCELNRIIRIDNNLLAELIKTVEQLLKLVVYTFALVAVTLENLRSDVLTIIYIHKKTREAINRNKNEIESRRRHIDAAKKYIPVIDGKIAEKNALQRELDSTSKIWKKKRSELEGRIQDANEEINDLKQKQRFILGDGGSTIKAAERNLDYYEKRRDEYQSYYDSVTETIRGKVNDYKTELQKADHVDAAELETERRKIRPYKEAESAAKIKDQYDFCERDLFDASRVSLAKLLGEEEPEPFVMPKPITKQETQSKDHPPRKRSDDFLR